MLTIDDFEKVKRDLQLALREEDKLSGMADQIKKSIKKDFGCRTLKEAKILLKKRMRKGLDMHSKYIEMRKKFDRLWQQYLKERNNASV